MLKKLLQKISNGYNEVGQLVIALGPILIIIVSATMVVAIASTPTWQDAKVYTMEILDGSLSSIKRALTTDASMIVDNGTQVGEWTFTSHAVQAHKNQKWNAVSIATWISSGFCSPKECTYKRDTSLRIIMCEDPSSSKRVIAIVVNELSQIVTGYTAKSSHWTNKCAAP